MGVAEKESGLLNVTQGRTAGKMKGGGGGQAYQCVCEDRDGGQAGCMNHIRMEK